MNGAISPKREKEVQMSFFSWMTGNNMDSNMDKENMIVVKTLKSKGTSKQRIPITVGDIKNGIALDGYGYPNEVVLFLRLNKRDR